MEKKLINRKKKKLLFLSFKQKQKSRLISFLEKQA